MGTYPPRECGIATFTQDLLQASQKYLGTDILCKVAALNLTPLDTYVYPKEVEWKIDQNNKKEYINLANELNVASNITGVIIQHEYGIYGGEEGENILSFIQNYQKTISVTLHTVLPNPSPKMKFITDIIISRSNIVIVLTKNSKRILEDIYPNSIGKVYVIPHGIHETKFSGTKRAKKKLKFSKYTTLSTFGLLNRGKGIEYVLKALPAIVKKHPKILYLILGATHPVIIRQEGEKYRLELLDLITKLNLEKHVKFYDQYLSLKDLLVFLKATDIYISTSINPDQAVSGTLSYALGTGRSVISTYFSQAKEVVTEEVGKLVPIKNSKAFKENILKLLEDKKHLLKMHKNAYDQTRPMLWSNVAKQNIEYLKSIDPPPINLNYLQKMTDSFGLFQFGNLDKPDKKHGYTLDDNARALIVICKLKNMNTVPVKKLIKVYLNFIEKCQVLEGSFKNYLSYPDRVPTDQNSKEDIEEATARAIWALSVANKKLPNIKSFNHLRSKAFLIKAGVNVRSNANSLLVALKNKSSKSWVWFEDHLDYNNAILPEGLFIAGKLLKNSLYIKNAKLSLDFLVSKTFTENIYKPSSKFDEQPEEPSAMVQALVTAYKITGDESYKNLAYRAFSWFLGNNSLNLPLYDPATGGCHDGLHPDRVNLNQGAESLVTYLLARLAIEELN